MIEETVKIIFTQWPAPTAIVLIVFFILFRKPISDFISNIQKIRKNKEGFEIEQKIINENKVEVKELLEFLNKSGILNKEELEKKFSTYEEIIRFLIEKNSQLHNQMLFWFFQFLNIFLVPHTKYALLLFKERPMTKEEFKTSFQLPQILNPEEEKEVVFSVLSSYKLIELKEDGLYHVSLLGEEFLKFIGYLRN